MESGKFGTFWTLQQKYSLHEFEKNGLWGVGYIFCVMFLKKITISSVYLCELELRAVCIPLLTQSSLCRLFIPELIWCNLEGFKSYIYSKLDKYLLWTGHHSITKWVGKRGLHNSDGKIIKLNQMINYKILYYYNPY